MYGTLPLRSEGVRVQCCCLDVVAPLDYLGSSDGTGDHRDGRAAPEALYDHLLISSAVSPTLQRQHVKRTSLIQAGSVRLPSMHIDMVMLGPWLK